MALLDQVIRAEYKRFDTPVDQIVSNPELAGEFTASVKAKLPADGEVDIATVNWRLMTLRKRGQDKGGLPRIRNAYKGRKPKPR